MLKKEYQPDQSHCKVTFLFPIQEAVNAREVKVIGEFNNWDRDNGLSMQPSDNYYIAEVELEAGKDYEFRYLVDNLHWKNEENADDHVVTAIGMQNSLIRL